VGATDAAREAGPERGARRAAVPRRREALARAGRAARCGLELGDLTAPAGRTAVARGGRSAGCARRVPHRRRGRSGRRALPRLPAPPARKAGEEPARRARRRSRCRPSSCRGERDPFGLSASGPNRTVVTIPGTHSLRSSATVAAVVREWLETPLRRDSARPARRAGFAGGRSNPRGFRSRSGHVRAALPRSCSPRSSRSPAARRRRSTPAKGRRVVGPIGEGGQGRLAVRPAGEAKRMVIFFHGQGGPGGDDAGEPRAMDRPPGATGASRASTRATRPSYSRAVLDNARTGAVRPCDEAVGPQNAAGARAGCTRAGPRSRSNTRPPRRAGTCRCQDAIAERNPGAVRREDAS
jgi:hypothetical protein